MSDQLVAVVYAGHLAFASVRLPNGGTAEFERDGEPVELLKADADHVLTNEDFRVAEPKKLAAKSGPKED